ncbi:30S ribosomal protein S19e [Candidatus Woesearchaeota archaeon]|jgi:small subunit ribosomal protein S19e|nr:30S ribosomal protein S19e [Candidatus Woesearchaeota archaeon]MBT7367986.1 30S ribosomal protein S19e [Candidatus Woesearchaeota archaeon]
MPTIFDVNPNELIEAVAKELQKVSDIQPPAWAPLVKTGINRERPPVRADWWYVRSAAILRSVRLLGPVGVSKLRTKYGGIKNRGHKPEKFYRAGGNIIRKVLQQLEKAGLLKQVEKGVHKGRIATPAAISMMDKAAVKIYNSKKAKPKAE